MTGGYTICESRLISTSMITPPTHPSSGSMTSQSQRNAMPLLTLLNLLLLPIVFQLSSAIDMTNTFSNPNNPYCRLCVNLFNTMVEKKEFNARNLCSQQPLNVQRQCLSVAASMKASKSVTDLLEGCTDTTANFSPELQDDKKPIITESNGVRATPCPGVIACNILEAHR